MARAAWFPRTLDGQQNMFMNVKDKIGAYEVPFGMTPAQVAAIVAICEKCLYILEYVRESKSTMNALTEWRDIIFEGDPVGGAAPKAPDFTAFVDPTGLSIGMFDQFRKDIDLVKRLPGYTEAAGEDLGIVGTETVTEPLAEMKPGLSFTTSAGYEVAVKGKMQRMDAIRLEFRLNGTSEWVQVAFLTGTPATFTIPPMDGGKPETGDIRGRYIKKNQPVGEYSDLATITIAP